MGAVNGTICKRNETCERKGEVCQGYVDDDHGFLFVCYCRLSKKLFSIFKTLLIQIIQIMTYLYGYWWSLWKLTCYYVHIHVYAHFVQYF